MGRRSRRGLASRPVLLFVLCFLLLTVFAKVARAQDTEEGDGETDAPDNPAPTDEPEPTDDETDGDAPTETGDTDPTETDDEPDPTTDAEPTPDPTDDDDDDDDDDDEETDTTSVDLPTMTGAVRVPTPTVPPKKGAPYLQQSNLPEGTIFIAVGAFLGLLAVVVIAWRVLVAWSINRSVRRTTSNNNQTDATALLQKAPRKGKPYRQPAAGSSMSMEKLGNNTRNSGVPPRTQNPNSSLFFSPTAGATMPSAGNRGSGYLPAGYYAASSAAAGGGGGLSHSNGPAVGLSPLGPQSQGYSRARSMGPSPPGSPSLSPNNRDDLQPQQSTSSLNLSSPPQGRAPSAYLEDLFENHPPGR